MEVGVLIQYRRGACVPGETAIGDLQQPVRGKRYNGAKRNDRLDQPADLGKEAEKAKNEKKKVCLVRGALQEGLVTGRFEAVAAGGR